MYPLTVIFILILLTRFNYILCISGGIAAHNSRNRQAIGVVLIDNLYDLNVPTFCTGALLTRFFVLTNGNCPINNRTVVTMNAKPFDFGDLYYVAKTEEIGTSSKRNFRLMLLMLDREVSFSEAIQPLSLPLSYENKDDEDVEFYGFGSINFHKPKIEKHAINEIYQREMSEELYFIKLPEVSLKTCASYYGTDLDPGNLKFFCYGHTDEKNYATRLMLDDNGAPLIGKDTRIVYGIANTLSPLLFHDWQKTAFPNYVIDVKAAVPFILDLMKSMMEN